MLNQDLRERLILTDHVRLRMAQRNVSSGEISYIISHGQEVHRAGAILFILRQRDIPKEERHKAVISRLEGTTVVLSREEPVVLTVWRNRRLGTSHIRRKPVYNRQEGC
jgi:hypothetical protein